MANYTSITWDEGETITREDLVNLTNNQDWIVANTPRLRMSSGTIRDVGNKIITGSVTISSSPKRTELKATVKLGSYFNPESTPICITQLRSAYDSQMFQLRTLGLTGTTSIKGDGFQIIGTNYSSNSKKKNIINSGYIDWVAYGW